MREFQLVGGLLDGILAVVHPQLYQAALALTEHVYRTYPRSRAVLAQWPSCYSAVQVIVNRETVRHRDMSSGIGWVDILLTLGSYGETAVMELRNYYVDGLRAASQSDLSKTVMCCSKTTYLQR